MVSLYRIDDRRQEAAAEQREPEPDEPALQAPQTHGLGHDGALHDAPMRSATVATVPEDLLAAIQANARARNAFKSLSRQNLFALAFRTNNMKTPAGRAKKIAALVTMLARGETIVPQRKK